MLMALSTLYSYNEIDSDGLRIILNPQFTSASHER